MSIMAADEHRANTRNRWIKTAFQVAVLLPFWALAMLAAGTLGTNDTLQAGGGSETWARLVGIAVISFGLIAGGLGACARFLDRSEEAEDLRRESRALLLGSGALVSAGISLILLSIAGPGRLVSPGAGLAAVLVLNMLATLLVAVRWRRLDELNRRVARDAGHLAFTWLSWVGGTWAILGHLGFVAAPSPLDWSTMLLGFSFVAGLVAFGRKGGFATLPTRARSI